MKLKILWQGFLTIYDISQWRLGTYILLFDQDGRKRKTWLDLAAGAQEGWRTVEQSLKDKIIKFMETPKKWYKMQYSFS